MLNPNNNFQFTTAADADWSSSAHQLFADNPVRDPFWKYPKCPLSGSPVQLGQESCACYGWFLELSNSLIRLLGHDVTNIRWRLLCLRAREIRERR